MSDELVFPQRIKGGVGWFIDENTIEIEGYYGAKIRISAKQEPPPPPMPEIVLTAWMADGDLWTQVTDRFEILEGSIDGDDLTFHIRTLADKMSAQEGRFFVNVKGLSSPPPVLLKGEGDMFSPRRSDFPHKHFVAEWFVGGDEYAIGFTFDGVPMTGSAATSNDTPHNWHYGFETVNGRIPIG